MLRLNSKSLPANRLRHLALRQGEVDKHPLFEDQVRAASDLWDNKSSVNFDAIRSVLREMCVSVEICVYCENNEATDIEHIFPKKLYPEKSFMWENYVLACGKCNSHHKSDRFKIFESGTSIAKDVTPPRKVFLKPDSDDSVFINQRVDDPLELLELDLINRTFVFIEKHSAGSREYERAKYTIELLGLNTRGALKKARENAALFFVSRLERYVAVRRAVDFGELAVAVDDFGAIDNGSDFQTEKDRILDSIKKSILENQHPTVWKEMIRQRAHLKKTNALVNEAPEVLAW